MPPKKTTKKLNLQKQKIEARLIEISLKVDDYIYNKRPISVEAAREYGVEVARFAPKCQGDVRSLQVIEKLTSVMKNIIEEQSKTTHEDTFLYNQSASDLAILNETLRSTSRSIQVQTTSFSERTHVSSEDKENKDENIDKTDQTNTANVITDDLGEDLERTLSNLSLSIIDTLDKEIAYFKEASPLKVSKSVNNNSADKRNVFDLIGPDSKDYTQNTTKITTTLHDTTATCTIGVDIQKESNKETSLMVLYDLNVDLPENNIIKPNILPSLNVPIANNRSATEPYGGIDALNEIPKNISPIQSNNKRKTQNKRNNNKIRKSKETQKTKRSVGAIRKRKASNTSNNIPENIKVQNKMKKGRSNNKGDVSDLSWVENLKYIRVINHMEYDTNHNIEDSFWNNCSLPSDWNDYF